MRKLFIFFTIAIFTTCTSKIEQKSNVLFITVDDLNDWLGITKAHPLIKTPNLDRFFESSVYFSNAHCATPICQASRNAMLTGLAPSTTGWYSNYDQKTYEENNQISTTPHLSEWMKTNGYYTMAAGKIYHRGISDIKEDLLWNESISVDDWNWEKPDYFEQMGVNYDKRFQPFPENGGRILSELGIKSGFSLTGGPAPAEELPLGKMHDEFITDWAMEKLKESRDEPFYLAIGYHRPHVPYTAPAKFFDLYPLEDIELPNIPDDEYADVPIIAKAMAVGLIPGGDHAAVMKLGDQYWKELIQAYLACITFIDHEVGRLLSELESSGLDENTIVILVSDHGQNLGEKKNWRKMCLWEESTKVPMAIRVPGKTTGTQNNSPASLLDVYPTLMDLTDLNKPDHLMGKSLAPFIENPGESSEVPVVTTWLYKNHSVCSQRYRYTLYRDGGEEFFDHEKDPDEHQNQIGNAEYSEQIQGHKKYLPEIDAMPVSKSEAADDRLDIILAEWQDEGVPDWLN